MLHLLFTGGTISMQRDERAGGNVPAHGGAALVEFAPALEQVATEMKGKVKVVKLDVDQNPRITGEYGIRAMPTLMLFHGGKPVGQHVGALVQKTKLEAWIKGSMTA